MSQQKRVKFLINKLNITQKEFAQSLGISAPRLNNYLKGARDFPLDISVKISELTKCDLIWLLTGNREPFYIESRAHASRGNDTQSIPVYAEIAAGVGIEAEDIEPTRFVSVPKGILEGQIAPFYAFEVNGVSMEPEMHSGDIVIVSGWDHQFDYSGCLCAFRSIDGLLVKRLFYDTIGKCLLLIPINPASPILRYDENSAELTLIGVVVALIRKYNKGDI
jgi:SOS-response transcriptional repressor LexA